VSNRICGMLIFQNHLTRIMQHGFRRIVSADHLCDFLHTFIDGEFFDFTDRLCWRNGLYIQNNARRRCWLSGVNG
jgi:hypothetical protein